jgi:hypothetical protein
MSNIVFVVTGAHSIANISDIVARERYVEYMIALNKVFTYGKPVYGVLSECRQDNQHCPPFHTFPMEKLINLPVSFLQDAKTKSQREFLSIKELIRDLHLEDDTFVIKVSGRYTIMKDTLYNLVDAYKNEAAVNAIICIPPQEPIQQYTFFFALRWKFFKEFFEMPLSYLGTTNIERAMIEYYEEKKLVGSILRIDKLDILANINNENKFQVF